MGEVGRIGATAVYITQSRDCLQVTAEVPLSEAWAAMVLKDKLAQTNGKPLELTVRTVTQKRTLDQNAYLWLLLERLAIALRSTAEEVYAEMLDRYGVHAYISAATEAGEVIKATFAKAKYIRPVRDGAGKEGAVYKVTLGSSKYDTAQFTRLLDGVIAECKELGIKTEV